MVNCFLPVCLSILIRGSTGSCGVGFLLEVRDAHICAPGLLGIRLLFKIAGQHWLNYLMGPYNAGPKSALFLRVAEIRAGVKRAGVKRAIFG